MNNARNYNSCYFLQWSIFLNISIRTFDVRAGTYDRFIQKTKHDIGSTPENIRKLIESWCLIWYRMVIEVNKYTALFFGSTRSSKRKKEKKTSFALLPKAWKSTLAVAFQPISKEITGKKPWSTQVIESLKFNRFFTLISDIQYGCVIWYFLCAFFRSTSHSISQAIKTT